MFFWITPCFLGKGVPLFDMKTKVHPSKNLLKAKATRSNLGRQRCPDKGCPTAEDLPCSSGQFEARLEQLNATLEQHLTPRSVRALARASGFQRRKAKKLTPWLFLQSACLLVNLSDFSLRTWAMLIGLLSRGTLATQSLQERVGEAAVAFLRAVLQALVESLGALKRTPLQPYLAPFKRALLEDSTTLSLGRKLVSVFPGPTNPYGTAATLKIQTCYDLCHQRFVRFALSSFRRNDQAAAPDALGWVRKGDLLIRDLGYFVTVVLERLGQRGVYFLSRLRLDTVLYEQDGRTPVDLLGRLRRCGQLDAQLLLGARQVPVRVVAIPVAPALAAERRRKARHNRDRRSSPTARHLALLGWTIFVTNVPRQLWPAKVVAQIYGIRWRIETIIKAWKSHFDLCQIPENASASQAQSLVYAKLIFIVLFEVCFWRPAFRRALAAGARTVPSLLKVSQVLAQWLLALVLEELNISLAAALARQIAYHCQYQKRRRAHLLESILPRSSLCSQTL